VTEENFCGNLAIVCT